MTKRQRQRFATSAARARRLRRTTANPREVPIAADLHVFKANRGNVATWQMGWIEVTHHRSP